MNLGDDDMLAWEEFESISVGARNACGGNTRDDIICWGSTSEEWWR